MFVLEQLNLQIVVQLATASSIARATLVSVQMITPIAVAEERIVLRLVDAHPALIRGPTDQGILVLLAP